jgi:hypothetical protein
VYLVTSAIPSLRETGQAIRVDVSRRTKGHEETDRYSFVYRNVVLVRN